MLSLVIIAIVAVAGGVIGTLVVVALVGALKRDACEEDHAGRVLVAEISAISEITTAWIRVHPTPVQAEAVHDFIGRVARAIENGLDDALWPSSHDSDDGQPV